MLHFTRSLGFLTVLFLSLHAREIETFYGPLEVEEPLLLELIDAPAFQRLKFIHQYGVSYYTTHREEYNRYDHSLGVFAILRANHASLEEQVAGLLHDVSHTAFSHVGDWVFGKENCEADYQNTIHAAFLKQSGLAAILEKYGIKAEQVLPKAELFPALECKLPRLCADRLDYNIQGAYYRGFITHEEALEIFQDLRFENHQWLSRNLELMKQLTCFSLFMTCDCWGSPANYLTSRWLADAILRGIEIGCFSLADLHFGTDQMIWDKLISSNDPAIEKKMHQVLHAEDYFTLTDHLDEADLVIHSKFRGIDPQIEMDSRPFPITEIDAELSQEYEKVKERVERGWGVILNLRSFP